MKDTIISTLTILISVLMIAVIPTDAEARIYEDTLRLHILANSDSKEDQELKLKIRDEILSKYKSTFHNITDINEAKEKISTLTEEIKHFAKTKIKEAGYDYDVDVELDEEWYETREYENFTLPAGKYLSLKVIIGRGEGKNWWCVMYPPLCTDIATCNAPPSDSVISYTKEELVLIESGKYNVKFKILEILSETFTNNG